MPLSGLQYGGEVGSDTKRITLLGNGDGENLVAVITRQKKATFKKLQVLNGIPDVLIFGRKIYGKRLTSPPQQNAIGYFQTKHFVISQLKCMHPASLIIPVSPILQMISRSATSSDIC
ncbi:MAG: hypothetical protein IPH18_18070 [Chitinophagaceae bacterium]|nr:hypothetical protein [Chitinophagaceae bacterium]